MIAPASGRLLSSPKAAVISSASGGYLHLADHRPKLAGKGRHHVHTLAAVVPGRGTPAQALAVDRHGSERSGPLRPGAQHLFGRGHVEGLVEVVVRRSSGTWRGRAPA